jgi:hypothetical protein
MNTCPTCKRTYTVSRKSSADKKLAQDIERAERAIEVLRSLVHSGGFTRGNDNDSDKSNALRVEAAQIEIQRLENAILFPATLWRIYRRADKGESYVRETLAEVAA